MEHSDEAFKDTSRPTEEAIILVSSAVLPWPIVRAAIARFTTPKSLPAESWKRAERRNDSRKTRKLRVASRMETERHEDGKRVEKMEDVAP